MNKVIMFTLGAAVGSLLTWKLIEEKYKQMANEEIEAVREHYRNKEKDADELKHGTPEVFDLKLTDKNDLESERFDAQKTVYEEIINNEYSIPEEPDNKEVWLEPGVDYIEPFVIRPEEYGDNDYEMKSLTYYADSVLADNDDDEIISDPESIIGNALNCFGEYEDDSVHVRNINNECDYEILKHNKTFSEIYGGRN